MQKYEGTHGKPMHSMSESMKPHRGLARNKIFLNYNDYNTVLWIWG